MRIISRQKQRPGGKGMNVGGDETLFGAPDTVSFSQVRHFVLIEQRPAVQSLVSRDPTKGPALQTRVLKIDLCDTSSVRRPPSSMESH